MRDDRLAEALVEFADTLVDDFDVIDFLHRLAARCVELLDVDAAALMLADQYGQLRVLASSSEEAGLMDLLQVQTDSGPSVLCFRRGEPVYTPDVAKMDGRWPAVGRLARELDLHAVHALPMRLRTEVIGVANLFRVRPGLLSEQDRRMGRALADVATIGLLQERTLRRRRVLAEQLQTALTTRVVIEQAKGVLAERFTLDMDAAFRVLREYARSRRERLSDVAGHVVRNEADLATLGALAHDAGASDPHSRPG
ncbi:GAF and ANTAR domain-containing protein [Actinocatenispora rupis]|uniref:Transcriptional regulator n=1 Tax=Actinocatenispora rupis TaxID=519421 RepID=A0A8J3J4Z5_9ACTN|nr:GAF and ANTAR domain-containing protein [Actinocatenispora rupis]GID12062.1 transcriptional regulator [Actinocatenispora rupis]